MSIHIIIIKAPVNQNIINETDVKPSKKFATFSLISASGRITEIKLSPAKKKIKPNSINVHLIGFLLCLFPPIKAKVPRIKKRR